MNIPSDADPEPAHEVIRGKCSKQKGKGRCWIGLVSRLGWLVIRPVMSPSLLGPSHRKPEEQRADRTAQGISACLALGIIDMVISDWIILSTRHDVQTVREAKDV